MDDTTEEHQAQEHQSNQEASEDPEKRPGFKLNISRLKSAYQGHYKKLLIIPFALLVLAIFSIGFKLSATGDFINRDVSLKGGVTITVPTDQQMIFRSWRILFLSKFPEN